MTQPADPRRDPDGQPEPEPASQSADSPGGVERLKTVSLRRRVTLSTIAVLAIALAIGAILVQTLFSVQSTKDVANQMIERGVAAAQLQRTHVPPEQIVRRSSGRGILANLTTKDGQVFGPPNLQQEVGPDNIVRSYRLPDGSKLTMATSGSALSNAQSRLLSLLIAVSLGTLCVTGLVLVVTVRLALRPLDTMTALARSISGGRRGGRLRPETTATELGRTSAAFDEMLDALEGAERQSRISEQQARSAEQQSRESETQARASEGRARQFLADAAHELRTPLAGVQAAAEAVLQAGPTADTDTRDRMNVLVIREARRATRLIEDLLSLARIDVGLELDSRRLDVFELVRTEVERTRLLAPSLRCELTGSSVVVLADPDRLGQVLTNLLDNARRYTPPGGLVQVRVGLADAAPLGGAGGRVARVLVADSGTGVPPADRERIFQRMVRLDEARSRHSGGSGLGLSIARGIAHAHGGDLACVAPEPGETGAVFQLTLPAAHIDGAPTIVDSTANDRTARNSIAGIASDPGTDRGDPDTLPIGRQAAEPAPGPDW